MIPEDLIDKILIGHKMKCIEEECEICLDKITTPNSKTLFKIIYSHFLDNEKDLKEENEETCLIIKLLLLKIMDDDKIHRISYVILKNSKVSLSTYLKINYIYENLLDEMNQDLKNLLFIKYGEIYDDLLFIINYFEEIFGLVKSRTEKVELVINKTNEVGKIYKKITSNLFYLKRNKRIYFDTYNMLQIITLMRLIFQKNIDSELMENLEYNYVDFLENVDKIFEENLSFVVRYDFYDQNWRIKKVPKSFIDTTRIRVDDLIDQSLEKIFPNFLGKKIIKDLEELIMKDKFDETIEFKTFIVDNESNARYVIFKINIIPNLDQNFIMFLSCHFLDNNILIIEENGNFVNGCEELNKKIGIKSEVITMSKGKINMYNVFNLEKNIKLEELDIVQINIENLMEIIKRVYLINKENINFKSVPNFLYEMFNLNNNYLTFDNDNSDQKSNRENSLCNSDTYTNSLIKNKTNSFINLNLFQTINVQNKKYIIYNLKMFMENNNSKMKEFNYLSQETNNPSNYTCRNIQLHYKASKEMKENNKETNIEFLRDKFEEELPNNNTHKSATGTNIQKFDNGSVISNTNSSDVFSFLLLKAISKTNSRTNYFEKFLYGIYLFNLLLVILGIFAIFYLNFQNKYIFNFVDSFIIFFSLRANLISSIVNVLSMSTFTDQKNFTIDNLKSPKEKLYENFDEFFSDNNISSPYLSYDLFIKKYNHYYSEIILEDYKNFEKNTYALFDEQEYKTNINYLTDIIIFNSIGNPLITKSRISDTLDYIPITINMIDKRIQDKIYINLNYLNFQKGFIDKNSKLIDANDLQISEEERSYFNENYNLYKIFINYFSVYSNNFDKINKNLFNFGKNSIENLRLEAQIILIVIVVLHIIFILISLVSILIYKRILLKEFNTLYSISEESLSNVKKKFKLVEEIIKSEKYPSRIYVNIRQLKTFEGEKNKDINNNRFFKNGEKNVISESNISNSNQNFLQNKLEFANERYNDSKGKNYVKRKSITNRKFERKNTKNNNKENLVELFHSVNYTGSNKFNSSISLKNKKKIEEIKNHHSRAQASKMLLSRLNFEFDFINMYTNFIIFMSFFYIIIGVVIIIILENKFDTFNKTLIFTNTFMKNNVELFNYLIGVKLSIVLNRNWPNMIKPENLDVSFLKNKIDFDLNFIDEEFLQNNFEDKYLMDIGFFKESSVLNNYFNSSNTIFEMQEKYANFKTIKDFQESFVGKNICEEIYKFDIKKIKDDNELNLELLNENLRLCKAIPIMHSNINSIFTNLIRDLREILNQFINSENRNDINYRVMLLHNKFRMIDTIYIIFVEPYFNFIRSTLIKNEINAVIVDFFNFLILIFTINILIDFLLLIFIWFKNYKQVIKYVNNIQLVSDSILN